MRVKIKKLVSHATIPSYANPGDAGVDLVAVDSGYRDEDYDFVEYGTGLAMEIPNGFVGLLFPRSSISKTPHQLCNSVGVIDSGYRGEIKLRFKTDAGREHLEYDFGDKIGQLVIVPFKQVEFTEVIDLEESVRGKGGFGSSDKPKPIKSDDLLDETKEILDGEAF